MQTNKEITKVLKVMQGCMGDLIRIMNVDNMQEESVKKLTENLEWYDIQLHSDEKEFKTTLEEKIMKILDTYGIPHQIKGYEYLIEAIKLVSENKAMSMTKELYPAIARKKNTEPSRVERAIRHAITVAETYEMEADFGIKFVYRKTGKPTNSNFIITIVDFLKYQK